MCVLTNRSYFAFVRRISGISPRFHRYYEVFIATVYHLSLLARRWESALLVNVDNDTLARLLASKEAMDSLMRIEGFRSLNADIETIINKSNAVKKAKKGGGELTPKQKKELTHNVYRLKTNLPDSFELSGRIYTICFFSHSRMVLSPFSPAAIPSISAINSSSSYSSSTLLSRRKIKIA